jgi:catechol 2,3-dioxygenase-like lactoylglutathione lyase family enzyme/GNAT superfamily N-acetyltransferase
MSRLSKTRCPASAKLRTSAANSISAMHRSPAAPLVSALNHIAIMTRDLDRFIDFYRDVLGMELLFREDTPNFRHAILGGGALSWLHPVQVPGNGHAAASDRMFDRGHLDHIALAAMSPEAFMELRERLVARGASDGGIDDLGAFQTLWFRDPDGMRVELTLIVDPALREFHAPVRVDPVQAVSIERLTDRTHWTAVDQLLHEYLPWVLERLTAEHGVRFDDVDREARIHHAAFASETDLLLRGRGRLLLAYLHGQPAGLVALKPVSAGVGEIKRLYVRPAARGHGIGRALLRQLLAGARAEEFHTLQLETLDFMAEARALYRSLGFAEVPACGPSQAALSGLEGITQFMTLALREPVVQP